MAAFSMCNTSDGNPRSLNMHLRRGWVAGNHGNAAASINM